LTKQLRLESCIRALEKLARVEDYSDILKNALAYYRKNKKLTPRQAFVVFWRLGHHRIDHAPSLFKITLKKKRHMEDLEKMETSRVHLFWRALTPAQRKQAVALGHAPPPPDHKPKLNAPPSLALMATHPPARSRELPSLTT